MINNFIKPGLQDLCVSRTSFTWGIPVSFDEKHVIYVWIDALSNYITSLGYLSSDDSMFKKYWPCDLHIVGKEIVRFHTIIWPIMLMALDIPLPSKVFGHGWLIVDGGKISKSLGNYKDPREYISLYSVDAVRYFALREVPFGSDGNFSEEALVNRINSDLANVLGNLVNRTITMANKYFSGVVSNKGISLEVDDDLVISKNSLLKRVDEKMNSLEVNLALDEIFSLLRKSNKYIDDTVPWVLAKDESKMNRLETVLFNLLDSIRVSAILLQPFIPEISLKILNQLNVSDNSFENIYNNVSYEVGIPEVLFKRIDK